MVKCKENFLSIPGQQMPKYVTSMPGFISSSNPLSYKSSFDSSFGEL